MNSHKNRMGLLSFLTQVVVLSSVFAGIRRYSGLRSGLFVIQLTLSSIQKMIEPKITNDYARIASKGFFDMGEFVVKKGTELLENAKPPKPPHSRE